VLLWLGLVLRCAMRPTAVRRLLASVTQLLCVCLLLWVCACVAAVAVQEGHSVLVFCATVAGEQGLLVCMRAMPFHMVVTCSPDRRFQPMAQGCICTCVGQKYIQSM
jgi:hypothetical protein